MSISRLFFLSMILFLTACGSSGVKLESTEQAQAEQQETAINPQRQITDRSPQAKKQQVIEEPPSELDMIANRLTAVQDHLLQIKAQSAEMQLQNQALFVQLQSLKTGLFDADAATTNAKANGQQGDPEAFNSVLDQITMMANELSSQVQDGPYRVASSYTSKGQWVLIRYHRYSGETWLADQGQWNLLEESGTRTTSEYEVTVLRADKDVKGYVASRIDRISGDTWWLKQNTWQPYLN